MRVGVVPSFMTDLPPGAWGRTTGGGLGPVLVRILAALLTLAIVIAALIVLLPVGIFLLCVAAILILWRLAKRWWARTSEPNGVFDGRRNVRVVQRADDDTGVHG